VQLCYRSSRPVARTQFANAATEVSLVVTTAAAAAAAAVCSVAAVVLGQLPGDWGFFTSYLTGAIVLVVLAVGSTAPGLLQVGLSV
jgi:hypothetical protein